MSVAIKEEKRQNCPCFCYLSTKENCRKQNMPKEAETNHIEWRRFEIKCLTSVNKLKLWDLGKSLLILEVDVKIGVLAGDL